MKQKNFIFALVAMLSCFVLSVNAAVAAPAETDTDGNAYVAKIGDNTYETFSNAITAAKALTGNVTMEIYGEVEFVDGIELTGSYTSISFIGKADGAKMTVNQTAGGDYLEAHGETVAFTDLILAKANPKWSDNSGHMGNYFSIQGGETTYTNCTFPNGACTSGDAATYNNCTFQNSSEYGLWVYDDALVTVNGGTIDSKKGIKVYSEDETSVTSTLTVQNATFTENITSKPAVAVGYATSITLIGNTYNNTTAHIELDSSSDADCNGITFVAQDAEGNDIASTLDVIDRQGNAETGVLMDGKIYLTVEAAAAEATTGSTITLLHSSTETVELPEGVTLDTNGNTAENVTVAGPTEVSTYDELTTALGAGKQNIILTADITIDAAITVADGTTIDLNDKTLYINVENSYYNNATIKNGNIVLGKDDVHTCDGYFLVNEGKTLVIDDVNITSAEGGIKGYAVFHLKTGANLDLTNSTLNISDNEYTAGYIVYAGESTATLDVTNSSITGSKVNGVVHATTVIENSTVTLTNVVEHGINRSATTIDDSNVAISGGTGRGITAQHGDLIITGNSSVNISDMGEATIELRGDKNLTIAETATVSLDAEVNNTTGGTITGSVEIFVSGLKGEGTEASPFLISNVDELVWFREKVDEQATDGSTQFAGVYFKLTDDIDLDGIAWNPIGSMTGDHGSFKGVFDGDGHTISNLNVNEAGNGLGLFARTAGNAVIKNLTLNNVHVESTNNSNYVGGLVGNAYASTQINDVHVTGNVYISGRGYIGGIAGHGYVVMDNVSVVATGDGQGNSTGLITSTFWCAGGILGYGGEGTTDIANAHVEGVTVTSAAGGLGAIVGMAEDNNGTQPISGSNLSAKNVEIKTYVGAYGDSYANYALGYLYGGNPTSELSGTLEVEDLTVETSTGETPELNDVVASVGTANYFYLTTAIEKANAGETVVLNRDTKLTEKIDINKNLVLNLNGKTITTSGVVSSRVFVLGTGCTSFTVNANEGAINSADAQAYGIIDVNTAAEVTVNGGSYDFDTNNGGLFKFRNYNSKVTLNNVNVETNGQVSGPNYSGNVLDVNGGTFKAANGYNVRNVFAFYIADATATFDNATIENEYIGAIECAGGTAEVNNCEISVTGTNSAPYLSVAVAVSGAGNVTVNGGSYSTKPAAASDANGQGNSHGSWTMIIMSSGGTMTINDGTFSNGVYEGTPSNPRAVISLGADADYGDNVAAHLVINDGTFNSIGALTDCETIWGSETDNTNTYMPTMDIAITDGDFTGVAGKTIGGCDPISTGNPVEVAISGGTYAASHAIDASYLAEGYSVVDNGDDTYTVKLSGEAKIDDVYFDTLAEAVAAVQDGETITLLSDVTTSDIVSVTKSITIDGNDNTLTYTGQSRAITVESGAAGVNLTVKNLTVDCTASYCQRGINYNTTGSFTLENVTVKGTNLSYAINLPGSSDGATVAISNSNLTGCIALNVWGENSTINVTDSHMTSVDKTDVENYSAVKLNNDGTNAAEGTTITITGGSITALDQNGEYSSAVSNATSTGTIIVSESTVVTGNIKKIVAAVRYEGSSDSYGCHTLQSAINRAKNDSKAKVVLLSDITLSEMATVDGAVKLDLNGHTISTGYAPASGNDAAICVLYGGNLTIDDSSTEGTGTIDGSGVYAAVKMTNTGDNAANGTATLTVNAGKLIGNYYAIVGNGGRCGTEIIINDGTITATQSVWGYGIFHPQDGTVTVNGGTITAATGIEMRGGSLVVNDGTIESTATELATGTTDSGTTVSGAAIALSQHTTNYATTVTVNGGKLSGPYAFYQDRLIKNYSASTGISATIASDVTIDGTVAANEKAIEMTQNSDGSYSLKQTEVVSEYTITDGSVTEFTNDTEKLVEKITYTRTLLSGSKWSALYLPFEVPVETLLADGKEVAYFNDIHSYDDDFDGEIDRLSMEIIQLKSGTLKANYPYLIRATSDEYTALNIELTDATLYTATENKVVCSSVFNTYTLTGSYKTLSTEDIADKYVVTINGEWATGTTDLKPFRLHLTITDIDGSPVILNNAAKISIFTRGEADSEGTTGVEEITGVDGETIIYDLQGNRVLNPGKGIYIVNGKKVIIR